eukprot:sb/3466009/
MYSRGYKSFQIQEVLISDRDEPKRLCNIYRPPYTGKARFTEAVFLSEFGDYLTDLMEKPGSPILCGLKLRLSLWMRGTGKSNWKEEAKSVDMRKRTEETKSEDLRKWTEEAKYVDERNRIEEAKSVDNEESCKSTWTEFKVITNDEIKRMVKDMANKHCGLDPMPTDVVKRCLSQLSPLLTALVNQSLSESSVPSDLQQALIFPTIKNTYGDRDSLSNYRPVSNIPFLSKLLEKVVLEQLSDYLKQNELLGKHQSGYRIGHSCETLLASMFDDFLAEMDKGKVVALVCLDMSAAFDTVDHQSLLKELRRRFGIGGTPLMWFESYLSSRSFRVSVGDSFSEMVNLICGVPQGWERMGYCER